MKKQKFSAADGFYDRLCQDYTLKLISTDLYQGGKLRVSAYHVENYGNAVIIRKEGFLGAKTEAAIFAPVEKDAPVFMMDRVKTLFQDVMSLNVLNACLSKIFYRQFTGIEEDYGKIPDADSAGGWYNSILIAGSTAKNIKGHEEAESMLEEYLSAFIKIMEFAEKCSSSAKTVKLAELNENFKSCGSESVLTLKKAMGDEKFGEFFDRVLFPKE